MNVCSNVRPGMLGKAALAGAMLVLASCGSSQPGRVTGGAATGAATGATIGLIGGPIGVVAGALIGAGAGVLTSTATSPEQVDLGTPPW
jgi:hypothetical protein